MKNKKKDIKQKSFFFDDYTESDINSIDKKYSKIQISLNRVTFLFFIFISFISIFSIKIIYLSLYPEKNLLSQEQNQYFYKERRDIVDRNGTILARNIPVYSVGVRPQLIKDKEKFLINLRIAFPQINSKEIKIKLNNNNFFYLKKRLTQEEKDKIWLLGEKAFVFESKPYRIYPQKNLFSHVLGQTDDNNNGISGTEKFFDKDLKNKKLFNTSLELTLDSNLQHLIREELIRAQEDFKNIGSAAVLMDIKNGEILSLISLPDYDLNHRRTINDHIFSNKITLGVYELGSVFKTFTIAAALENNIINSNTIFKNLKNSLTCGKHTISEHDKLPENLNTEQILIRSSNIGAVRIAQQVGVERYRDFLNSLELLDTINFDLEEIGTPLLFKWGKCKLATTSYGHGITTTPLQLAKAYAILGNGGYRINPSIIKNKLKKNRKKIISNETSSTINNMLRKVVSLNEGTANFADIEGYDVGGKTGTALKYNSNAKLNTFVSIFPSKSPKYVLLVMLDEPKPAPNFVYNFPPSEKFPKGYKYKGETRNTSGWNTVVVAGKIIEKIGPILAIKNLQASKNF
jgi:cell division protein FtsI (penicillin-binding protein 3)